MTLWADSSDEIAQSTPPVASVSIKESARRRFFAELRQSWDRAKKNFELYRSRIQMLKSDAKQEEIIFSDASEKDFWEFILANPYARHANVVVTDRGNLRAVWHEKDNKHMGFEFLGDRWVEYVIWTRRAGAMKVSPKAGRDTLEGVREQIRASGLTSFLG